MTSQQKSYTLPMIIIGALFFIFGFVTWVNGTLIPYLKIACQLETDFQSYLVATAFFIAYTVMALPSSYVLSRTGYKKGMAIGLLIMALGAILFVPAANARNFNMFLVGLFIIGTGLALLQTASNPYVSIIGPIESAAKRISIMGICNKVAGILAGLIFGYIALKDADALEKSLGAMDTVARDAKLDELASRVVVPYIIISGVLAFLAVAILFSSLPDIKDENGDETKRSDASGKTSVLQFPHLLLGVLALFLYVGVEVMAGDTIISYGKSLGIELSEARFYTQFTLAFMLVGYVIGIFTIPKFLSQSMALRISAVLGVIFTLAAVVTNGKTSVTFIALLGLANSLMWPAIFPLAIDGLGRFTKIGSALLVMAIAGGAILPLIYGKLSQSWGTREAYAIMIPCYLYILYFAARGYKAGKK
ncbi:sugar MFS transporter [Fulvivirgaceae bacterium PWU4]|uniref:Sugar MFS transporter n=1 Tax=Chryseosolibacter histidini TaxID=2782349 RepID=A0AAP2GT01_9BACT|nr:sugar MFS transporter [Chryseosolibacter histidini]MBT1701167.1 sugar MFS transporter [Chryseosolibacter histidini]